jgi:hypothetical protein
VVSTCPGVPVAPVKSCSSPARRSLAIVEEASIDRPVALRNEVVALVNVALLIAPLIAKELDEVALVEDELVVKKLVEVALVITDEVAKKLVLVALVITEEDASRVPVKARVLANDLYRDTSVNVIPPVT